LAEFSAGRCSRQQLIGSDCKQDGKKRGEGGDSFPSNEFLEVLKKADHDDDGGSCQTHKEEHIEQACYENCKNHVVIVVR
jgi:hypothetical protein